MTTGITETLAAHTAKVRYEDIPPEAIEKAKDCILDQVGVELIGSTLEWNKIAYRYVTDMGGRAESTIVNYGSQGSGIGRRICQRHLRSRLRTR